MNSEEKQELLLRVEMKVSITYLCQIYIDFDGMIYKDSFHWKYRSV